MSYAIYLRKSRSDNGDESIEDTLCKHKKTLLDFSKSNNLNIEKIYEEVVSGDKLVLRPQMLELLEDVENGKYTGVLCMDIDRLGRGSMSDQGIILEAFKNSGTKILTPRKIYDLSDEFDEEYTEFETFMARRELKMISRRLHRGTKSAIDDGAFVSDPPFGYVRTIIDKRSSLAIHDEEANFVRMMFEMYLNGAGCQTIADTINSMGAKPHRAQQFGRTSVRIILRNPVYTGKTVWNKCKYYYQNGKRKSKQNPKSEWIINDGLHPAIIDENDFARVQEIFDNKWHPPYYSGQLVNSLAGVIKCSVCGAALQRRPFVNRNLSEYLLCPTRGCCAGTKYDLVEQEFFNQVKSQLKDLEIDLTLDSGKKESQAIQTINLIEKEYNDLLAQKERLYDLLEQGIYTIDVYSKRMELLENKITECNENLHSAQEQLKVTSRESRLKAINKIKSVLDAYDTATPNEQNIMLKSIIKSAVYLKEKGWKVNQFFLYVQLVDFI